MGKKPLLKKQVKTLRSNLRGKPLQELLLNLGVGLMLRSPDLLNLRVSDVISKLGTIKTEMKVKQKKTGKTTQSKDIWWMENKMTLSSRETNPTKNYSDNAEIPDNNFFQRLPFLNSPIYFEPLG